MARKKMIICIAVLLAAVLAVAAVFFFYRSKAKPYNAVIDGEGWSAEINGAELLLRLPANPTTGYTWTCTEHSEKFVTDYNEYTPDAKDKNLAGAGGVWEFHFIALNDEPGTAVLEYARSWETGKPAEVCTVRIDTARHGNSYIIDSVNVDIEQ